RSHPRDAPIRLPLPSVMWRELRPGEDSELDRHIGPAREVAWTSFPLERLKRIGHRCGQGVTVNDVVLGVVAGGLRRWLEGNPQHKLRVQVPVSLHAREEGNTDLGNRDSFMNVDLPIAEPDPVEGLRLINAEARARKPRDEPDRLYAFS